MQRSCPRKEQHTRGSAQDVLSSKGEFRISWESCSLVSITNWAGTAAGGNRRMFCSRPVLLWVPGCGAAQHGNLAVCFGNEVPRSCRDVLGSAGAGVVLRARTSELLPCPRNTRKESKKTVRHPGTLLGTRADVSIFLRIILLFGGLTCCWVGW